MTSSNIYNQLLEQLSFDAINQIANHLSLVKHLKPANAAEAKLHKLIIDTQENLEQLQKHIF